LSSIANFPVTIQTSSQSVPSTPCWFDEVALIMHFLKREASALGYREASARMPCRHFGRYDLNDFVAVLLGYAISGERTLDVHSSIARAAFCQSVHGSVRVGTPISSLDAEPRSSGARPGRGRGSARPLSERSPGSPTGRVRRKQEDSGIERGPIGWSSMLMARDKPPANEPYPRLLIITLPSFDCVKPFVYDWRAHCGSPYDTGSPT